MSQNLTKETVTKLLTQRILFKPPAPNYRELTKILKSNTPNYLEMIAASMMIEATYNGNVNAAKLLLGILMEDKEEATESMEIPQND